MVNGYFRNMSKILNRIWEKQTSLIYSFLVESVLKDEIDKKTVHHMIKEHLLDVEFFNQCDKNHQLPSSAKICFECYSTKLELKSKISINKEKLHSLILKNVETTFSSSISLVQKDEACGTASFSYGMITIDVVIMDFPSDVKNMNSYQSKNSLLTVFIVPPSFIKLHQEVDSCIVKPWTDFVLQENPVDYRNLFLSSLNQEHIDSLLKSIPSPIAYLMRFMIFERDPRSQFRALLDLFELMIKIYGFIVVNERSDSLQMFKKRQPTIGTWLFDILKKIPSNIPEFLKHDIEELKKDPNTKKLLNERNSFTHSSLPSQSTCLKLFNNYILYIKKLIFAKSLFNTYSLFFIEGIQKDETYLFFDLIDLNNSFENLHTYSVKFDSNLVSRITTKEVYLLSVDGALILDVKRFLKWLPCPVCGKNHIYILNSFDKKTSSFTFEEVTHNNRIHLSKL